ncbi:MAG: hypothetical protein NWF01_09180 [Candidatus Bathyarchaeota archaeon]|nr:hypothetical protein [Candidatus Bathyarchaeota archaeon]
MDKADKTVIFAVVILVSICGAIIISGLHSTVAPSDYVLKGNFTVASTEKYSGGTTYVVVWHGANATCQVNTNFSYTYQEFQVFEGKNFTIPVTEPMHLYENFTKLLTLYP